MTLGLVAEEAKPAFSPGSELVPPPDHQNKKPRYSRRLARPGVALWLGASSGFALLRRERLRLGWSLAEPGAQGGTRTPTPLGT